MLFPVSGVEVSPLVPPLVAFAISFFTSMGGVTGAFLLLPFQMSFLGFTTPSVSATNQLYNIVATPSGIYRYLREGRMVWPLVWVVVAGTAPGVMAGSLIRVRFLPDPVRFKVFAGAVLLYLGVRLVLDVVKGRTRDAAPGPAARDAAQAVAGKDDTVTVGSVSWERIVFAFRGHSYEFSPPAIFGLSLAVGVVGGVYGIGGGAIMAPFLVAVFGLPVHAVAGAALAGTFATSIAAVVLYQAIAPFYPETAVAPDWLLGLLFGVGGIAGMYCGARLQKHVPARAIKVMLAVVVLFVALRYVLGALL